MKGESGGWCRERGVGLAQALPGLALAVPKIINRCQEHRNRDVDNTTRGVKGDLAWGWQVADLIDHGASVSSFACVASQLQLQDVRFGKGSAACRPSQMHACTTSSMDLARIPGGHLHMCICAGRLAMCLRQESAAALGNVTNIKYTVFTSLCLCTPHSFLLASYRNATQQRFSQPNIHIATAHAMTAPSSD